MSSDLVRYLATGGAITLCGSVAHVISLKMRLRFSRYVVDRAVEQGQPIDPVEIINAATSADRLKGSGDRARVARLRKPPLAKAAPSAASPALPQRRSSPPELCSR
jgi:hypothetical protein